MRLQTFNSTIYLSYGCSLGKHFIRKLKKFIKKNLKVIYDKDNFYNNLLLRSNSVYIHQRYLQFLMTKRSKSISQINTDFMHLLFKQKKLSYNFRKGIILNLPSPYTTVQMLLTFEILLQRKIYLLKLNPAIQFSNLKSFTVILCIFVEMY